MSNTVTRATYDQVMVPNYSPAGFVPVRGAGSRVWDQDGREYIDFVGGIAVNGLGHCHPELVAALTEQAGKLWHLSNVFTNEPVLNLASRLTEATFADRAMFCNSGAEANEAAFKLARKYAYDHFGPEKHQIISCFNSFHGRTLFTVSVGGQAKYTEGFAPLPGGIDHIAFNDIEALKSVISDKTCAVVIEPVQGEGGVTPADPAFLQAARELCDQYNAALIFDEVQCGFGRSGSLYAYMQYGIEPDILTTAKALGGGFPIAGMLAREKFALSFSPGTHGSTYGGNPLASAVALKSLEIISRPEVMEGVKTRRQLFVDGFEALNKKYHLFKNIRGMGLLLGCELEDKYAGRAREILRAGQEAGVLLLVAGGSVLRFTPSLVIDEADIAEGLKRLDVALASFV